MCMATYFQSADLNRRNLTIFCAQFARPLSNLNLKFLQFVHIIVTLFDIPYHIFNIFCSTFQKRINLRYIIHIHVILLVLCFSLE